MASDIHRKRTGRGLKVSEEIVVKEEMYEEMEDDMPRYYKSLAAHLKTDSPELNHRVSAYIASQTAMATMAKYNAINRMFSEVFPQAASYSQQTHDSHYMSPLMKHGHSSPSITGSASSPASRNPSTSTQSHSSIANSPLPNISPSHTPCAVSAPTPNLSPATISTDVTESAGTLYQAPQSAFTNIPLDPQLVQQSTCSFTSELSNEVKMMAKVDMTDPMAMHFFGDSTPTAFPMPDGNAERFSPMYQLEPGGSDSYGLLKPPNEYSAGYFSPVDGPTDFQEGPSPNSFSQFGIPGCGDSGIEGWESFVDYDTEQ
ncbi:hypothetical protein E0Z10_g4146 [Xylaria hypoxylon]|uniref:Uncharacterized protein n=1 Tax=Xylaria hypoxylon TaxID=37992 RepID=A0A4Z0Z7W8_9PEZI|nr:hypothetical protein E0Z10_g4146 [Xylaria hypoxylon]